MPSDEVVVHLKRTELAPIAEDRTCGDFRVLHLRLLLFELEEQVYLNPRRNLALADLVREPRIAFANWFVSIVLREMARKDVSYFLQKIRPPKESSLYLESSL